MLGPNQTAAARRKTRQIHVGSVAIGGDAPISVQSMTNPKTADAEGILQQIYALAAAGADIVRCTCNEAEAAEGLARIVPRSPVPIIADIHHQYRMALAALEAGVQGLRLNPGNIRRPEHIKAVAQAAKDRGVPIRYAPTAAPVEEARAGRMLLEAMGLRERKDVDLIACPSCGRAEIDVFKVANDALAAFGEREIPLQVAVMGCVVNGPGEARDADLGIAAGRRRGHLFVKGKVVKVVPEDEMVDALVEWAELIQSGGVEAALAKADAGAAAEAERDRAALLDAQGSDVNASEQRVELIKQKYE